MTGLELTPEGDLPLAQFECAGTTFTLRGAPVAVISHGVKHRALMLKWKINKGTQSLDYGGITINDTI